MQWRTPVGVEGYEKGVGCGRIASFRHHHSPAAGRADEVRVIAGDPQAAGAAAATGPHVWQRSVPPRRLRRRSGSGCTMLAALGLHAESRESLALQSELRDFARKNGRIAQSWPLMRRIGHSRN